MKREGRDIIKRGVRIAICLLIISCTSCFQRTVPTENAEKFKPILYNTKTSDGWTISVKRFKKANYSAKKFPVVLCHGFNQNDRFWYLDKNHSLAYYLYEKGYDVWVPSLRGSGDSTKPGLAELRGLSRLDLLKLPQTLAKAAVSLNKLNWNIDDHIQKDIPVILELVKKETGYEKVNWLGHSLGGMIAYAYLGGDKNGINNLVAIGSPMIVPQPPNDLLTIIRDQRGAVYLSLLINSSVASQFQAMSGGFMRTPIDILFYNSDNMERDVIINMYRRTIEDIAPAAIDQLRVMIAEGDFLSSDRKVNYTKALSRVNVPIMCIGGMADNLAPAMSVYYAYENASSQDKTIRIFSLANGYSADYGHNDLLLGKKAREEVYPYIYQWLERRQG